MFTAGIDDFGGVRYARFPSRRWESGGRTIKPDAIEAYVWHVSFPLNAGGTVKDKDPGDPLRVPFRLGPLEPVATIDFGFSYLSDVDHTVTGPGGGVTRERALEGGGNFFWGAGLGIRYRPRSPGMGVYATWTYSDYGTYGGKGGPGQAVPTRDVEVTSSGLEMGVSIGF